MSNIVLDETLLKEFFKFYLQKPGVNRALVTNIFCKLQPFLVTTRQMEACGIDRNIIPSMINNGPWISHAPSNKSWQDFDPNLMQEMVTASKLKFMLTHSDTVTATYKTVSIKNQKQDQLVFAATYKSKKIRTSALVHLQELMRSAKKSIYIRDPYLKQRAAIILANMMGNLPLSVKVHFFIDKKRQHFKRDIFYSTPTFNTKAGMNRLRFKQYDKNNAHDRYIQIDHALEIIISSGFDHLFSQKKDCSYIIRVLT